MDASTLQLSIRLIKLAQEDGGALPHALEGETAISEAKQLLKDWLGLHPEPKPNGYYWNAVNDGLKILESAEKNIPLQMNPLFQLPVDCPYCFQWAPKAGQNGLEAFDLFTPLVNNAYAAINVHYTEAEGWGGLRQSTNVFLNMRQWEEVTDPLILNQDLSRASELEGLLDSIIQLERLVGESIGTSSDRGGWQGNDYIYSVSRPVTQRQQRCNDEFVTTASFLHLIGVHNLLRQWQLDPTDAAVVNSEHVAPVMKDNAGAKVIIDTWLEDNGVRPHVFYRELAWEEATKGKD